VPPNNAAYLDVNNRTPILNYERLDAQAGGVGSEYVIFVTVCALSLVASVYWWVKLGDSSAWNRFSVFYSGAITAILQLLVAGIPTTYLFWQKVRGKPALILAIMAAAGPSLTAVACALAYVLPTTGSGC
jgi:hypothetical protein